LIGRLTDNQTNIQDQAAYSLGRIGRPGIAALAASLQDPDVLVRAQVARALAGLGIQAKDAASALMEATRDPAPIVRENAVEALGNVWPYSAESVQALSAALKDED